MSKNLSKILKCAFSLLLLTATGQSYAQSPATSGGCIGQTPLRCAASIASVGKVLFTDFDKTLPAKTKMDVNGRPINEPIVANLWFRLPIDDTWFKRVARLKLNDNGLIDQFNVDLFAFPGQAQTELEFDRTGLGFIGKVIFPSTCSQYNKIEFYRFFLNQIRPTIKTEPRSTYSGVSSASDTMTSESKIVPTCDIGVQYHHKYGMETWRISATSSGDFDESSITFSAAGASSQE